MSRQSFIAESYGLILIVDLLYRKRRD